MVNRRKFNQENVREAMRIHVDIAYADDPRRHAMYSDTLDGNAKAAIRETTENNWDKFEYRLGLPRSGHAKLIGYVKSSLLGKRKSFSVYPNDGGAPEEAVRTNAEYAARIEKALREAGFKVV